MGLYLTKKQICAWTVLIAFLSFISILIFLMFGNVPYIQD